ncbi:extracellular solute-binding protein [Geodermatophilus sp. TF02-6]|uniref:sugar ABC transporter substrate-binding protein n=1 Tax=Geodermatophilus sp. TF02-6 TaxID=2250575 RepID=UPI001314DA24|nr:extracellular solute-binding protein [Geodermatophilus sp. TF02-6]
MRGCRWKLAVGAIVATTTLGACGGGTGDAGGGGDSGLLIWAGSGTGGDALKQVAQRFGEENGVPVDVELLPGDELQTNFVTASQGNNAPDVVCGAHDWIGNLVQNGTIDPIQLLPAVREDLQPLAVQAVTYNGQVYGMPFTMNSLVLYRNTDLAPDAPATIEDLVATGQQLQAAGRVTEVLALPVSDTGNAYFMYPLFTSAGGYVFGTAPDGSFDSTDLGLAAPQAVTAYQQIGALGEKGQGVLKRSISAENDLSLFTDGHTAFMVEGPWQLPNLAKSSVPYDISPVPGFADGGPASPFITVDACYVASRGEHRTLGQEYVANFWSRPDVQAAYQKAAEAVPASLTVLDQIRDTQPLVAEAADIAAQSGQIMPSIPEMAAVWDPWGKAEAAVVAGADPRTTITAAATTIRGAIGG